MICPQTQNFRTNLPLLLYKHFYFRIFPWRKNKEFLNIKDLYPGPVNDNDIKDILLDDNHPQFFLQQSHLLFLDHLNQKFFKWNFNEEINNFWKNNLRNNLSNIRFKPTDQELFLMAILPYENIKNLPKERWTYLAEQMDWKWNDMLNHEDINKIILCTKLMPPIEIKDACMNDWIMILQLTTDPLRDFTDFICPTLMKKDLFNRTGFELILKKCKNPYFNLHNIDLMNLYKQITYKRITLVPLKRDDNSVIGNITISIHKNNNSYQKNIVTIDDSYLSELDEKYLIFLPKFLRDFVISFGGFKIDLPEGFDITNPKFILKEEMESIQVSISIGLLKAIVLLYQIRIEKTSRFPLDFLENPSEEYFSTQLAFVEKGVDIDRVSEIKDYEKSKLFVQTSQKNEWIYFLLHIPLEEGEKGLMDFAHQFKKRLRDNQSNLGTQHPILIRYIENFQTICNPNNTFFSPIEQSMIDKTDNKVLDVLKDFA